MDSNSIKVLLSSVNKTLSKAKVTGNLNLKKLYLLNIINKYITCDIDSDTKCKLEFIARKIQHSEKYICNILKKENTASILINNERTNNFFKTLKLYGNSEFLNTKPIVGNINLDVVETPLILTESNFTTSTDVVYSDSENDVPAFLKILSLPDYGILTLNNINVTLNQIISFTDINSGLLIYNKTTNLNELTKITFNFAIADSGSLIFSK